MLGGGDGECGVLRGSVDDGGVEGWGLCGDMGIGGVGWGMGLGGGRVGGGRCCGRG